MPRDPSTLSGAPLPQGALLWRYLRLVALSAGARGIGFATVVLMARGLGVEMFGEVTFAKVVVNYGLTLTAFGLGIFGVRASIRDPEETGRISSTIILIRMVLGLTAFVGLAIVAWLPPFRDVATLILLFGGTLFTGAISVNWVAQAQQRTDVIGFAALATQLLFMLQVLAALQLGFGKHAIPVAQVTSELVVNIALLGWMYRRVTPLGRPFDLGRCRQFITEAAPIAAAQMLRALSLGSDMLLLGMLVAMQQVGTYGVAFRMRTLGVAVVGIYMTVVLPHLTHHGKVSVRRLSNEVGSLLWKMLLLAVPAALLAILLTPWILSTLFGAEYLDAATPMRLLILATVVTLIGTHYRPAILALGRHGSDLTNIGVSTTVHVGSKLALIPLLGPVGAALGTIVGETAYALYGWLALRRLERREASRGIDSNGGGPEDTTPGEAGSRSTGSRGTGSRGTGSGDGT